VDYADPAALAALADQPVDVALDLIGGDMSSHVLAAVRPGGILIALTGISDALRITADAAGIRVATTAVQTEPAWLEQIRHLAAVKALVPEVARIFGLADAAEAHRFMETGHVQGKVVLRA
jgi:NADPH:quinone reductase-like Zn-dependent oxidoreductase